MSTPSPEEIVDSCGNVFSDLDLPNATQLKKLAAFLHANSVRDPKVFKEAVSILKEAVEAEREACAALCERHHHSRDTEYAMAASNIANAIRSRSEKQ